MVQRNICYVYALLDNNLNVHLRTGLFLTCYKVLLDFLFAFCFCFLSRVATGQLYHCLETRKYCIHWQEWVALLLRLPLCLYPGKATRISRGNAQRSTITQMGTKSSREGVTMDDSPKGRERVKAGQNKLYQSVPWWCGAQCPRRDVGADILGTKLSSLI